jgi:hypothetical protein
MMENALITQEEIPLTPADVKHQIGLIQEIMKDAMKSGEHYGVIPGCGDKPSLLKPGAEKLNLTFRMAPDPEIIVKELSGAHREYQVKVKMNSIVTGRFLGAGVGSASTMETKWRYRKAEQKCPKCGKEAIIRGKKEYGGGWLCFTKKGGCGARFKDGDTEIENQNMGRIEHDNPADYYNTCLKMAKKRALVDAVLTVTAASDIFTQDIEEMAENGTITTTPQVEKEITPQTINFLDEMKKCKVKVGKDKFEEILTGRYSCMKAEEVKPEDQQGILGEMEKAYQDRIGKDKK